MKAVIISVTSAGGTRFLAYSTAPPRTAAMRRGRKRTRVGNGAGVGWGGCWKKILAGE
jgi:hypothetical protein